MKKYILLISFICFVSIVNGQQALTFYTMDRAMQSSFVNPASNSPYKFHIGGIIIPIFGQIPPPMYINYANNSFHYNHIFHKGNGSKSDNLVLDFPLLMDKLQKTTNIRFENQIELLNVGFKIDDKFFTISLTEKIKTGLSIPYDMFGSLYYGNAYYMNKNKPMDFSKFDMNFTHYRELALGASLPVNDKLRLGSRVKFLFGMANVSTKVKELSAKTNPDRYFITLASDMAIYTSLPINFEYKIHSNDSITLKVDDSSVDAAKYLVNFNNFGLGLDFGFEYKLDDKIKLFGSLTDLGLIFWNSNPQNFKSKGEFEINGIQISQNESDNKLEGNFNSILDTLVNKFRFQPKDDSGYTTWLSSSLYLGGEYKLHEKLNLGALYRGEFYRKSYMQSLALFAKSNLTSCFSAHVSYAFANNSFTNLGVGLTLRLGFVNWYIVTDNLPGLIWPQKSKNMNIRMGCNLVFGYKKIESKSRI